MPEQPGGEHRLRIRRNFEKNDLVDSVSDLFAIVSYKVYISLDKAIAFVVPDHTYGDNPLQEKSGVEFNPTANFSPVQGPCCGIGGTSPVSCIGWKFRWVVNIHLEVKIEIC